MAGRNWRDWLREKLPPWLREKWGGTLTEIYALLMDAASDGASDALKAPWIIEPTSPSDALPMLGNESAMPKYPIDTDATYRQRIYGRWGTHRNGGSGPVLIGGSDGEGGTIIGQLEAFGLSDIEIKTDDDWNWDGRKAEFAPVTSRFWLIIKGHPWTSSRKWGAAAKWGDGGLWGLNATRGEIDSLRNAIRKFRAAHETFPWIIVVTDEAQWDADQPVDATTPMRWDRWKNRSKGARYISGVGAPAIL